MNLYIIYVYITLLQASALPSKQSFHNYSIVMQPHKQTELLPTLQNPLLQSIIPVVVTSIIKNSYIEELKTIFMHSPSQIVNQLDTLINIFHKTDMFFLIDLSRKMGHEDFKNFVKNLQLVQKCPTDIIVQKSKKPTHQYLLVQGTVSYNIKSQTEQEQLVHVGTGYPGFAVYPQIFMAPRHANFTIRCQTECTFLCFSQQQYNKYLKKNAIKQIDKLAQYLHSIPLFSSIGAINLRKYLSYFIPKSYKYNEIIYAQGSTAEEIYFVAKGQVQISVKKSQGHIGIVNLGQRECFGLQNTQDNCVQQSIQTIRKFTARSRDSQLKLLVLHKTVFEMMKAENGKIIENSALYLNKVQKLHASIIARNIKVMGQQIRQENPSKIPRKKKKKGKKQNKNSLTWWGLAQNVKIQQKYRMPSPPKLLKNAYYQSIIQNDQPYEASPRTLLMTHKINELKRRAIEQYSDDESDKQNQGSPYKNKCNYVPKIKARIRMLEARPKAIDMAEVVKKKLITYAKNMSSFCERLNLE